MTTRTANFPGIPQCVADARHWIMKSLNGFQRRDDVELLASEIITNAILHGIPGTNGTIRVHMRLNGQRIHVQVRDPGHDSVPHFRAPNGLSERGRGLEILDLVSDRWGFTREAGVGTTVWFELRVRSPE